MASVFQNSDFQGGVPRNQSWLPAAVRSAAGEVVDQAQDVRIDVAQVPRLVSRLETSGVQEWMAASPVKFENRRIDERLTIALVFNAMSFCYWPAPWWDNDWYASDVRRGTWALLAAIRHALDAGVPLLDPDFLCRISSELLVSILDGRGRLAFVERRAEILREIGSVLQTKLDGCFRNLLESCAYSAPEIVGSVVAHFPSFTDVASHGGRTIAFQKRAQLLTADCHHVLCHSDHPGLAGFRDLTACADYMLPALLVREGVLVYSDNLQTMILQHLTLPKGGRLEIEIRAATLVACDILAEAWKKAPMVVNDALWLMAGETFSVAPVHHRTWTEAY